MIKRRRSKVIHRAAMCLIVMGALISACGAQETPPPLLPPEDEPIEATAEATVAPPTETQEPTPTDVPEEAEATPLPTATPEEADAPEPTVTPEPTTAAPEDWARYVDAAHGFGFSFPPTWSIDLLTDREDTDQGEAVADGVRLTGPSAEEGRSIEILIEFKHPEQATALGSESLPEGEIEERDAVRLLDRALPVYVLRHEEKDKAVFVGERFLDLEFFIRMQEIGEALTYEESSIPEAAHETFAEILGSITRTDGVEAIDLYPEWATYENHDLVPGFTFRYPATWTVSETITSPGAPVVLLSKETYLLTVQVKQTGTSYALGPETTPEGLIMEAGMASFMQQLVHRNVLVHEDKLKMIFVTHEVDDLEFYIALTEDPEQIPYDEIELSEAIRHEMDQILASFQLQP